MRFYTKQHKFFCGIDLHARSMFICIVDEQGKTVFHRNRKASPQALLKAIEPYREDIVVAVECVFVWYWLSIVSWQHSHSLHRISMKLHVNSWSVVSALPS